jgi:fatty-acyl-CoA synthase
MSNRPEFLQTFFAVQRIGAIFVPVNVLLAPPELERTLEHTEPVAVVTSDPFADACAHLRGGLAVRHWIGADGPLWEGGMTLDELAAGPPGNAASAATLDDPAAILYSSGTTGGPKGAVVTHSNILHMTLNWLVHTGINGRDRSLLFLPLCFTGGLMPICMPILHAGGSLVLHRDFDPGRVLAAIECERVSIIAGVPTTYRAMLEHPALDATDLSSLRLAIVGAAPVPPDLLRAWREREVPMLQAFGITEGGGLNLFLPAEAAEAKHGSCGVPLLYSDARIVDEHGREPAPGEVGELLLAGPVVMKEYWRDAASTEATLRNGWLHTGDLAVRDEDGFFTIVDRKKDIIITGGLNVYPAEVEAALCACEGVSEAAVVGLPDEVWGELVTGFVIPSAGFALNPDRLIAASRERIAAYKAPRAVHVVDDLPRTASGKVRRSTLRERFRRRPASVA